MIDDARERATTFIAEKSKRPREKEGKSHRRRLQLGYDDWKNIRRKNIWQNKSWMDGEIKVSPPSSFSSSARRLKDNSCMRSFFFLPNERERERVRVRGATARIPKQLVTTERIMITRITYADNT
jgi:hypothetical protein